MMGRDLPEHSGIDDPDRELCLCCFFGETPGRIPPGTLARENGILRQEHQWVVKAGLKPGPKQKHYGGPEGALGKDTRIR